MTPEFPKRGTAHGALFTAQLLAWGLVIILVCSGGFQLLLGPSLWAVRGLAGLIVITIVCFRRRRFLSEGFQAVGWLIATMLCLLAIGFGLNANIDARPPTDLHLGGKTGSVVNSNISFCRHAFGLGDWKSPPLWRWLSAA